VGKSESVSEVSVSEVCVRRELVGGGVGEVGGGEKLITFLFCLCLCLRVCVGMYVCKCTCVIEREKEEGGVQRGRGRESTNSLQTTHKDNDM